jgi:hypothetical protein
MDSSPLQGKGKAQPELKPSQPSQAHVCFVFIIFQTFLYLFIIKKIN